MRSNRYKHIIKLAALFCLSIGVLVIIGWLLNIENLKTVYYGYASMKFNTALCFVFSGCAVLFFFMEKKREPFNARKITALLIAFIGIICFAEDFFNITTKFDELFVADNASRATGISIPGRMSSATSFSFILVAFSIYNLDSKKYAVKIIVQWALHIVTLIALITIMGYIYKVPSGSKLSFLNSMAIHTALGFSCLCISLSLVNPSFCITGLFTGDKIGNIMVRRLFPVIFFVSLGTTYLRLEVNRHHLIGPEFAAILFSTVFMLINLFLIWKTAIELNKIDVKRKDAEEVVLVLNKQLEFKVEKRTAILKDALQQLETSKQELKDALQKEKELNEMKSRFVSMASHEFKTPLSTIMSSASLVSSYVKPQDEPSREKHVQRIKNSVKHLNQLLEDFLSLGKLEEKRVNTDAKYFDVKTFLSDTMEEIEVGLKKGQQIQLQQTGADAFITDKRLLKNILLNILGNAIKFSPENSHIIMQLNNENNELYISIKDDGIGILKEDQQHLFSSFFRGANATSIEGTGLGLHIVKRYVELLKGTINLQSEYENGTTVIIKLPQLSEKISLVALV